ncbi:MAG: hypothetical protein ABW196_11375 [Solirubrobacterales bacterium]
MHRSPLIAFCALLVAALTLVPVAFAHEGHDHQAANSPAQTCTTASPQVVGGSVSGKLTSSNVDPVQARFATCSWATKVMKRATELGVEEPRPVRSFYCRPSVSYANPDKVSYICTFRGADTATFIKLTFQVTYKA